MSRICQIDIDDSGLPAPTAEVEQERKVAVFDLLEDNSFALPARGEGPAPEGPFRLALAIREKRLVFDIQSEDGDKVGEIHLSGPPSGRPIFISRAPHDRYTFHPCSDC